MTYERHIDIYLPYIPILEIMNKQFTPEERRRFKLLLKDNIENIFRNTQNKQSALRVSEFIILAFVDNFGTAIAISDKSSSKLPFRKVTDYTVASILNYLTENDYIYYEPKLDEKYIDNDGGIHYKCIKPATYFALPKLLRIISIPANTKLCKICHEDLDVDKFSKHSSSCKKCYAKQQRNK